MIQLARCKRAYERVSARKYGLKIVIGGFLKEPNEASAAMLGFFDHYLVFEQLLASGYDFYCTFLYWLRGVYFDEELPRSHKAHLRFERKFEDIQVTRDNLPYLVRYAAETRKYALVDRWIEQYPDIPWIKELSNTMLLWPRLGKLLALRPYSQHVLITIANSEPTLAVIREIAPYLVEDSAQHLTYRARFRYAAARV